MALQLREVRKSFGGREVLRGISFETEEGKMVALMGPNGSGKTTLLRILATLDRPSAGEARVCGFDVTKDTRKVREKISCLPQEGFLSPALSGEENLLFYGGLLGMPRSQARRRSRELLERFGLGEDGRKPAGRYSGGMRRKLALACALLQPRPVLLLDEPTAGLDPVARRELLGLLLENTEGCSVLLATHIGEDAEVAGEVLFMCEGRILDSGAPEELKKKYVQGEVLNIQLPARLARAEELLRVHALAGALTPTHRGYRVCVLPGRSEAVTRDLASLGLPFSIEVSAPSVEDALAVALAGGAP